MGKKFIKVLDKTSKISGTAAAIGVSAAMLSGSDIDDSVKEAVAQDKKPDVDKAVDNELSAELPLVEVTPSVTETPVTQNVESPSAEPSVRHTSRHSHSHTHHASQSVASPSAQVTEVEQVEVDADNTDVAESGDNLYVEEVGFESIDQAVEGIDDFVVSETEIDDDDDEDWMNDNFVAEDDSDLIVLNDAETDDLGASYTVKEDGDMFAPEEFSDTDIPDVVHDATNAVDFL